jgi:DNA (cytosine-5)-methyltransferase 1
MGNAAHEPRERNTGGVSSEEAQRGGERELDGDSAIRLEHASAGMGDGLAGPTNGHWRDADWLRCRDGKWRPVEPGTFPLASGIPNRMGRLRAYGNAIVPQVAAVFVMANRY